MEEILNGVDKILGREYTYFGTSNRDLILKTRGKLKVWWGKKFIDIIKDGKLNVEDKDQLFKVYQDEDSIDLTKDGLIFIQDTQNFYLVYNGSKFSLVSQSGDYVSLGINQNTTSQQKQTALNNIGLFYLTRSDAQIDIQDGKVTAGMPVYISGEGLFVVDNFGQLISSYLPVSGGSITGNLSVSGNINVGNTRYTNSEINFNQNFNIGSLRFETTKITSSILMDIKNIVSDNISSTNFRQGSNGFGMYILSNGQAIIEADQIIQRNPLDNTRIYGQDLFYIASCYVVLLTFTINMN